MQRGEGRQHLDAMGLAAHISVPSACHSKETEWKIENIAKRRGKDKKSNSEGEGVGRDINAWRFCCFCFLIFSKQYIQYRISKYWVFSSIDTHNINGWNSPSRSYICAVTHTITVAARNIWLGDIRTIGLFQDEYRDKEADSLHYDKHRCGYV